MIDANEVQRAHLTEREVRALTALLEQRAQYLASGHGIAARAMGVAIWLAWQVFRHTDCPCAAAHDDEERD